MEARSSTSSSRDRFPSTITSIRLDGRNGAIPLAGLVVTEGSGNVYGTAEGGVFGWLSAPQVRIFSIGSALLGGRHTAVFC